MVGLALLAMGIDRFCETGDFGTRFSVQVREMVEAARFGIAGIISESQPTAGSGRPSNMDPITQNPAVKRIIGANADKHIFRQDRASRNCKILCFAALGSGDMAPIDCLARQIGAGSKLVVLTERTALRPEFVAQ